MDLSTAEVNYISAIYHLSKNGNRVSTNALANEFSIAPASVTDMMQKLADKKLVEYIPYKGVSLLPIAEPIAKQFYKKHQLWKQFLEDKLGISEQNATVLANEFQEVRSDLIVQNLKQFLQQEGEVKTIVKEVEVPVEVIVEKEIIKEVPVEVIVEKLVESEVVEQKQATLFDSIANEDNSTITQQQISTLKEVKIGKAVVVLGVKQLEQDLRDVILHYGIKIGQEVKLLTQYDFDNSFLVEIDGVNRVVAEKVAEQILVQ